MPDDQVFLIAKDDDFIAGVCKIEKGKVANHLWALYVLPQYQRKGIGILLWKNAKKFLNHNIDTFVNVAVYNTKAINFYKKIGFIETGRFFTEEHYKMPVSGVIIKEMEMLLKSGKSNLF